MDFTKAFLLLGPLFFVSVANAGTKAQPADALPPCVLMIEGLDANSQHVQIHGSSFEGRAGVSDARDEKACNAFCETNFKHQTRPDSIYVSSATKFSTSELRGTCLLKDRKIGTPLSFKF